MMRFDRFTERAQDVAQRAVELAVRYGHSQVDVEHMLLALVSQPESTVLDILVEMDVDHIQFIEQLEQLLKQSPRPGIYGARGGQQLFTTPRVKRVLDLAQEEASALKDEYISSWRSRSRWRHPMSEIRRSRDCSRSIRSRASAPWSW
jgi:ATP-dependent Clp protease ATP-binding subunit ClpC